MYQYHRFTHPCSRAVPVFFALLFLSWSTICLSSPATTVFINELHYDNSGPDTNEGIEIAGPEGQDLTGWRLLFYNGSGGTLYRTEELSGVIPDQGSGFGTLAFAASGLQNGPDGFALADPNDHLIQFISYEDSFMATEGLASGVLSDLMEVFEDGRGSDSDSLQLAGSGSVYEDFFWTGPRANTFASLNEDQSFIRTQTPVPAPGTLFLLFSGIVGFTLLRATRNEGNTRLVAR
ncbi:MAG: PEP-CTERM sorting domain-containing protein [Gammaproteobacteria bacterium]|nr:PEP-CTERM sorting domain-containing protein [Gammaproteobacteria bacterium]